MELMYRRVKARVVWPYHPILVLVASARRCDGAVPVPCILGMLVPPVI